MSTIIVASRNSRTNGKTIRSLNQASIQFNFQQFRAISPQRSRALRPFVPASQSPLFAPSSPLPPVHFPPPRPATSAADAHSDPTTRSLRHFAALAAGSSFCSSSRVSPFSSCGAMFHNFAPDRGIAFTVAWVRCALANTCDAIFCQFDDNHMRFGPAPMAMTNGVCSTSFLIYLNCSHLFSLMQSLKRISANSVCRVNC